MYLCKKNLSINIRHRLIPIRDPKKGTNGNKPWSQTVFVIKYTSNCKYLIQKYLKQFENY